MSKLKTFLILLVVALITQGLISYSNKDEKVDLGVVLAYIEEKDNA